jgi:hypothetical protein
MPGSAQEGPGPPETTQLHTAHYSDANNTEIAINQHFCECIERIFGLDPNGHPESGTGIFVDLMIEARHL